MHLPKTRKETVTESIHGQAVSDPYRWLEENTDEVKDWVRAQNAYARKVINTNTPNQKIKERLSQIFRIDDIGMPSSRQGRYFFVRRKPDQDFHVLYIQESLRGVARVLIDPNALSADKSVVLQDWRPSVDGKLLLYHLSTAGNDEGSLYVLDVETGKQLSDVIPAEVYPYICAWSQDGSGFWYTRRRVDVPTGEEKLHKKVYFHQLGEPIEKDRLIFGEQFQKEDWPSIHVSEDNRYLLGHVQIYSSGKERSELYLFDRENVHRGFQPLMTDLDAECFANFHRGNIYVLTNYQAPRWRLLATEINQAGQGIEGWHEVLPEGDGVINAFTAVQDCLFIETMHNVIAKLTVHSLAGEFQNSIDLPTLGSIGVMRREKEEATELFFSFSSYTVPPTIYRYDLIDKKYSVFIQDQPPVNFKSFQVEQKWFNSKDGTHVPMFIVCQKGLVLNNENPVFIYGYGGYGVSTNPEYIGHIIPFLEAGGIYVEVNLRGGGEFGKEWHEAGTQERKQNVFDDFIGAIEYLIAGRYTNSKKIAIFGWSNGGLLTSTVMVQRPDLIRAVVVGAPVTDMIRYHRFHGARHWIPEYGSAEQKEQFFYLFKYSPYHNVKAGQKYPATLIVTADQDDRVHPMHAYKFLAMLREKTGSENPILLRVEQKAGHNGARALSKAIDRFGDILGFVFWQLGMKINDRLAKILPSNAG